VYNKEYDKKYRQKNKKHIAERKKKRYIENRSKRLREKKIYYKNNKKEISKTQRNYRQNNKLKINEYQRKYQKEHPEMRLNIMKRHLEKYGKTFDMNPNEFMYALISWSKTIKKIDSNMCKNCDSTKNINAHHIQPKQVFPELCLDLDNGITLCSSCHSEAHGYSLY